MANSGFLIRTEYHGFQPDKPSEFESVAVGEIIQVKWGKPRNYRFHRKMFALFRLVHENMDRPNFESFTMSNGMPVTPKASFDATRKWLVIKAGYFDVVGYPDGSVLVQAKSLAFHSMASDTFEKVYSAVIDVALEILPRFRSGTQLDAAVEELLRFDG